jgi:hypothetical protein
MSNTPDTVVTDAMIEAGLSCSERFGLSINNEHGEKLLRAIYLAMNQALDTADEGMVEAVDAFLAGAQEAYKNNHYTCYELPHLFAIEAGVRAAIEATGISTLRQERDDAIHDMLRARECANHEAEQVSTLLARVERYKELVAALENANEARASFDYGKATMDDVSAADRRLEKARKAIEVSLP